MSHVPATDLATEIGTQVGGLTLGTNLFHSSVRAPNASIPINSVFVWGSGGKPPLRTMSQPDEIRSAVVHVRVRDRTYSIGSTLAHTIMNTLRGLSVSTYLDLVAAISEPRSMGQDSESNHYFGMEYLMTYTSN